MGWGEVALMIPWQPAGGITSRGQREKVTMENCAPRVVLLDACLSLGPLRPTVFRVFGCPSLGLAFSQPPSTAVACPMHPPFTQTDGNTLLTTFPYSCGVMNTAKLLLCCDLRNGPRLIQIHTMQTPIQEV